MVDNSMRVSDRDREAAVAVLRDAFAAGRLDMAELTGRAAAAYGAKTWDDLRCLVADLPWAGVVRGTSRAGLTVVRASEPGEWVAFRRPAQTRRPLMLTVLIALAGLILIAAAWRPLLIIPLLALPPLLVVAG